MPRQTPTATDAADQTRGHSARGASPVFRAATGPISTVTVGWLAALALVVLHSPHQGLLAGLGFVGAAIAGLVGLGGAIVMIPLLLYVSPLFGLAALDIRTVSGITMVQVAAAGFAGTLGHLHWGAVDGRLVATLGGGMAAGSLAGALGSGAVSSKALSAVFAGLAALAAVIMFSQRRRVPQETGQRLHFDPRLAAGLGFGVGVFTGMVGAGGGFLLMPLMLHVLRIPIRWAVGASLGIVTLSGVAGAVGKYLTGQVDWPMALALVAGALPGARLGAAASGRFKSETLALILGTLIAGVALGMWWEILFK